MKILDKLGLKILTKKSFEEILSQSIDNAISKHREAHPDFFSPEYANQYQGEYRNAFQQKVDKIKNPGVKDIINSSFTYFPDEEIRLEELWLLQSAAREKFNTDPLWTGVVGNLVDYVIGRGTTVSTPVQELTEELMKFRKRNNFLSREKYMVQGLFIDGEYFNLIFTNNMTGDCYVRRADTKTITEIETAEFDIEAILSFRQDFIGFTSNMHTTPKTSYFKNIDYEKFRDFGIYGSVPSKFEAKFLPNAVCKHSKLAEDDQLRGRPPARTILKYMKLYENFVNDRLLLNHERAKVVWIKKITGRNEENSGLKNSTSPRGGTMLVETENISYRTEKPNLDASEAKEDALALLYYIGSGLRFPLHVLNQRTDQQVYASIRKADTPFSTMIQGFQWYLGSELEPIYRHQLLAKVGKKGGLKDKYTYPAYSEEALVFSLKETIKMDEEGMPAQEIWNAAKKILKDGVEDITKPLFDIPISQDFPQILQEDPLQQAQTLKVHREMGIASLSTLATKAGYNWDKESSKIMMEAKSGITPVSMDLKAKSDPSNPQGSQNAQSQEAQK